MKVITQILLCLALLSWISYCEGSKYSDDLLQAGLKMKSVLIENESNKELYDEVFEYIAKSKTGMTYFLYALQLSHEMLNEPEMKKVLEFLTENGIDIMKLFTVKLPPGVFEALQDEDKNKVKLELDPPKLPKLDDLINMDDAVKVGIQLLEENKGVQQVFKMLSKTSLQLEVYGIIAKYKDADSFKKLFDAGNKIGQLKRIILGLVEMFTSREENIERFLDGMKIIMECSKYPEKKGCAAVKEREVYGRVEL